MKNKISTLIVELIAMLLFSFFLFCLMKRGDLPWDRLPNVIIQNWIMDVILTLATVVSCFGLVISFCFVIQSFSSLFKTN